MSKQVKNRKRTQLLGTLSGVKRVVKFIQPYFRQNGVWHKLKSVKGV